MSKERILKMSKLYDMIAAHYDVIFPFNAAKGEFLLSAWAESAKGKRVLEVGCGTGSLSIWLAERGCEVVGIDLDAEMVRHAILKAEDVKGCASFRELNMLDLDVAFSHAEFDAVVCFGNTLVHLEDDQAILRFLRGARQCLHPGGHLLLQILNYDRILCEGIDELPLVETEDLIFERSYRLSKEHRKIDFGIRLTDTSSDETMQSQTMLYAIGADQLCALFEEAGFSRVTRLGDYTRTEFCSDSFSLVIDAV